MSEVTFFFGGWPPVLRVLVVGTLAYLALLFLHRVSGKRTLGQLSAFDLLITVAIGAVFGRVLTAHDVALIEALTAFGLLVGLQFAVTWIRVRWTGFSRAVTAPPTLLFYRGKPLREAMRDQRITEEDLRTAARTHGLGSLEQAEAIVLEANGKLAVIKPDQAGDGSAIPEPPGR